MTVLLSLRPRRDRHEDPTRPGERLPTWPVDVVAPLGRQRADRTRLNSNRPAPTTHTAVGSEVVGNPEGYDVTTACLELSGRYGIDVSPMIVNTREFHERGDNPLLDDITNGTLVKVRR